MGLMVTELTKHRPLVSQNDQSRVERSLILMRHSNSGDKKFRLLLLATGSDGRTESEMKIPKPGLVKMLTYTF